MYVCACSCTDLHFLFANGIPAIAKIGIPDFLLGQKWKPSNNLYGILPFILGSIYVTAGSIVIGVPLALLLSVFLAFYCPKRLYPILKTMVNLMAGIPSVVYGFFGLIMIVPLMCQITGKDGSTMLTASILLGIMNPSDCDRSHRIGASQCTHELLRRSTGTWGNT